MDSNKLVHTLLNMMFNQHMEGGRLVYTYTWAQRTAMGAVIDMLQTVVSTDGVISRPTDNEDVAVAKLLLQDAGITV